MHQTSAGTKKNKKKKNPVTSQKWTHSSWKFVFFGFFGACAGLVHLVVWFFAFFWCLCRFGDSGFTKHWQAPKNKKNKPLDAPNIDRHQKKQKNKNSSNYSEVDP